MAPPLLVPYQTKDNGFKPHIYGFCFVVLKKAKSCFSKLLTFFLCGFWDLISCECTRQIRNLTWETWID